MKGYNGDYLFSTVLELLGDNLDAIPANKEGNLYIHCQQIDRHFKEKTTNFFFNLPKILSKILFLHKYFSTLRQEDVNSNDKESISP
jgi:hypothetical protein